MVMKKLDWSGHDQLLGTMPDRVLAVQIGCGIGAVFNRRQELGINCCTNRYWDRDDEVLLEQKELRCTACGNTKPTDNFRKSSACARAGRMRQCIDCLNRKKREARADLKAYAVHLMGGSCRACGFSRYMTSLQFHHVLSELKEIEIARLLWRPKQKKALRDELDKCCLLCSNCHDAYQWGELPLTFSKSDMGYTVKVSTSYEVKG